MYFRYQKLENVAPSNDHILAEKEPPIDFDLPKLDFYPLPTHPESLKSITIERVAPIALNGPCFLSRGSHRIIFKDKMLNRLFCRNCVRKNEHFKKI